MFIRLTCVCRYNQVNSMFRWRTICSVSFLHLSIKRCRRWMDGSGSKVSINYLEVWNSFYSGWLFWQTISDGINFSNNSIDFFLGFEYFRTIILNVPKFERHIESECENCGVINQQISAQDSGISPLKFTVKLISRAWRVHNGKHLQSRPLHVYSDWCLRSIQVIKDVQKSMLKRN